VERIALPFQTIEVINEPRERTLFSRARDEETGWRNKLIWGDNKYVMASLLEEFAGKVDLIYIDPPFATGQDFSFQVRVGGEEITKEASIIEEKAYRDTWGKRLDSYLQMMYERLALIWDLLGPSGNLWVHLDELVSPYIKVMLDEKFGQANFVNQVTWRRVTAHGDRRGCGRIHDCLLWYAKGPEYYFQQPGMPLRNEYVEQFYRYTDSNGRRYRLVSMNAKGAGPARRFGDRVLAPPPGTHWRWSQEKIDEAWKAGLIVITEGGAVHYKQYLDEHSYQPVQSIWDDEEVRYLGAHSKESVGFETQKPEGLLKRIINMCSPNGGLVADFFCGSGTTLVAAEKLGRRWIGCDLSRFAIQVTRKRLLDIPDCKPFEVLNLGKYERQYWQMNIMNGQQKDGQRAIFEYLEFIVELYQAQPVIGFAHLHGRKAGRMVHVGAVDAPVTFAEVRAALEECQANGLKALDVLGWEWEMGLNDLVKGEAANMGIDLRLLNTPREVMDKRAVEAGDVHFYELAHLELEVKQDKRAVTIVLKNFAIPSPELIPPEVRDKIKRWSDYIDFWAVDWDYRDDTFRNQWQSFRTRKHPTLATQSEEHHYQEPGTYKILVKAIDIFGNDTTKLLEVKI
jgi:adenine specific DNA methylase Mod